MASQQCVTSATLDPAFVATSFAIGKIWRKHRRCLPSDVCHAYCVSLSCISRHFRPPSGNAGIGQLRKEMFEVMQLLDNLAGAKSTLPLSARGVGDESHTVGNDDVRADFGDFLTEGCGDIHTEAAVSDAPDAHASDASDVENRTDASNPEWNEDGSDQRTNFWLSTAVPVSILRPWQVYAEHLEDQLADAVATLGGGEADPVIQARLNAVHAQGAREAFLDQPVDVQRIYVDVSSAELSAYVVWQRAQQRMRNFDAAWDDLVLDDKAGWMPEDHRAALTCDAFWADFLPDDAV